MAMIMCCDRECARFGFVMMMRVGDVDDGRDFSINFSINYSDNIITAQS